jgi:uncharacterized protein YdaU (DUF1376 family)
MSKAPAFQFYPKQFLGDDQVLLMSTEAIGAHILLMCVAWQQDPPCSLPNDTEKIRKWTRLGIKSWRKRENEILSAWRLEGDRWYQDGLLKEKKKQEELSIKREQAANKRWNTIDANALQVQSTSNALQSSSSTSSSIKTLKQEQAAPLIPSKDEIDNGSTTLLSESIERLSKALYDEKIFPEVFAFKNKALKKKANLRAVVHTLTKCYTAKPVEPWAYCVAIMAKEDGNFNARDYEKDKR